MFDSQVTKSVSLLRYAYIECLNYSWQDIGVNWMRKETAFA